MAPRVESEASLSKAAAGTAPNAMFPTISDALVNEEMVSIAGFGMFLTRNRPVHRGWNTRTGESTAIASSTVPSFKARKALRDAVNYRTRCRPRDRVRRGAREDEWRMSLTIGR